MGSCLPMIIQLPILFALYRVIWNIPAYVNGVKEAFLPLAESLLTTSGAETYLAEAAKSLNVSFSEFNVNSIIDVLYKFNTSNWTDLSGKFSDLSASISSVQQEVDHMNYFLGLNIANSPLNIITDAWKSGAWLMLIGAILVPVLSAVTQWLNTKLMTQTSNAAASQGQNQNDTMANTMKTMNNVMPIMSAVFCLTLPVGMGIYWIAGAVVRGVQQVIINKKVDSLDLDEMVKKNMEKMNKKREKQGLPPQKITNTARTTTKNIEKKQTSVEDLAKQRNTSTEFYKSTSKAKPGSLAAKAQMVQQYNEKNNKKK